MCVHIMYGFGLSHRLLPDTNNVQVLFTKQNIYKLMKDIFLKQTKIYGPARWLSVSRHLSHKPSDSRVISEAHIKWKREQLSQSGPLTSVPKLWHVCPIT